MKKTIISAAIIFSGAFSASATVLFQDNFNVTDNTNFDSTDLTGRLSGAVSSDTVLRSHRAQQQISNNQLLMVPTGGVRFNRTDVPFAADTRFDWASGTAGTTILSGGGFNISFDWTPDNNTATQWIAMVTGTPNGDTGGVIVNSPSTDYGILFRKNGGVQRFDNNTLLVGDPTFGTTAGGTTTYPVSIDYSFSSFADGSNVSVVATIRAILKNFLKLELYFFEHL